MLCYFRPFSEDVLTTHIEDWIVKCSRAVRNMSLPAHDPARHLQEHSPALLLGAVDSFKKGREVILVLLVITISSQALLRLGDVLSWALRAA